MAMLKELKKECAIVLIVNRLADIPEQSTHLAMLENLEVAYSKVNANLLSNKVFINN